MISFLMKWVEQVAIAIILSSIFELVIPKGNSKKYIKIVLGMYVILSIMSPFLNIKDIDLSSVEDYIGKTNSYTSGNVSSNVQTLYEEELKENIKEKLNQEGYKVQECEIDMNLNNNSEDAGINKIEVVATKKSKIEKIEKVDIGKNEYNSEQTNNEDERSVKEILSKYYEISEDKIEVKIN